MPKAGEKFMGRDFTPDERKKLAKSGVALSDGSYPIQSESDLKDAARRLGEYMAQKTGAPADTHTIGTQAETQAQTTRALNPSKVLN